MRLTESQLRSLISEAIRKAYEILGVSPDASQDQIKAAYRQKAIALHPDRNPGKNTSADAVKVNVAFGLLSDPEKRRKYDQIGDKTLGDFGNGGPSISDRRGDDFWRDMWRTATQDNTRRERASQEPGGSAHAGNRRYFEGFDDKKINRFWWCELHGTSNVRVGSGVVGATEYVKVISFRTNNEALMWMDRQDASHRADGYVKKAQPPPSAPKPPPYNYRPGDQPPPSAARASEPAANKVYYEYNGGTSHKFWWIEMPDPKTVVVGWGRIGTSGQTKRFDFQSATEANEFRYQKQREKRIKGYVVKPTPGYQQRSAPSPASPKPNPVNAPSPNPSHDGGKQYRIYGRRGGNRVHTRYKGRVYVPSPGAEPWFYNGARAEVKMGADGKLRVSDPKTGKSQEWVAESLRNRIDQLITD